MSLMAQWQMVDAIASVVSAIAIVASAIFIVIQLRQAARDRYVAITSGLFQIWESPDFQEDQLFLLHKLPANTWEEFTALGRGDRAERALFRVGGFYDRVGHLVKHKLIRRDIILPVMAGNAILIWHRIEPLVLELRRRENAFLFQNYEAVLPECRECYVPVLPVSSASGLDMPEASDRIDAGETRRLIDRKEAVVLEVSKAPGPERIAGALRAQPNDLAGWLAVLPQGKSVVTYCT